MRHRVFLGHFPPMSSIQSWIAIVRDLTGGHENKREPESYEEKPHVARSQRAGRLDALATYSAIFWFGGQCPDASLGGLSR